MDLVREITMKHRSEKVGKTVLYWENYFYNIVDIND